MSTIRITGGLRLEFSKTGSIAGVAIGGKKLPMATNAKRNGQGGFSVVEVVQPRGELRDLGVVAGKLSSSGNAATFAGELPRAALSLNAKLRGGDYLDVSGEVIDHSGADRALKVTFTLPAKLAGWTWHNTADRSEKIATAGHPLPNKPADMLSLGVRGDRFDNEYHDVLDIPINKLPFMAVTRGELGLAIAYPVHEPRVFMLSASDAGLSITFSLGVSPITRQFPSRASFRFIVYPIDGRWGIRSAAERYHAFFPELTASACKRHGNIAQMINPARRTPPDNFDDFGCAFAENDYQLHDGQMTEATAELARKWGVEVFHWRGPWYWFHAGTGDETQDEQLALLKAQAEGRAEGGYGTNNQMCGAPHQHVMQAGYNSYLEDEHGKLNRTVWLPSYGCWLMPGNMDPNLPAPNRYTLAVDWQFRYIKRWDEPGFRGPKNFAYDALDDWGGFRRLNFRRDHIAVCDTPPTFDPTTGRLCQIKGFTDWAFARNHTRMVHDKAGLIMANVNLEHAIMYCGQFIDVIHRERHQVDYDEERLSTHRMMFGGKPISFGWTPKEPDEFIEQADKLLAFGMAPGDRENLRELLRIHMPLMRRVAESGYRMVPHASADGMWIERFGDRPGSMFLAVRNRGAKPSRANVRIELGPLGLVKLADKLVIEELHLGQDVVVRRRGQDIVVVLDVPARRTAILAIGR